MKKILILSANPIDTSSLRLDEEVREIQAGLERAKKREQFKIISKWALRPEDLQRALLDYEPEIVHFSGHGNGDRGLVLENNSGKVQLVNAKSLAGLFKLFKNKIECVVLNSCYSEVQAEAIFKHISCVVGMKEEIGDKAAIKFAVGFYDALGAGRTYNDAFEFGCNSIDLAGIPEYSTPVLKLSGNIKADINNDGKISGSDNEQILQENPVEQVCLSSAFYIGQVPLDSPFYIERPPIEFDCYETILKPGSLIRVKAPRQMGKSSLMTRILNYATSKSYQAANLNFQDADADFLDNLDYFLRWFCSSITEELDLPDKLNDYWKGVLGSKNKCTKYFEKYLLPQISGALALGLDEVDEVFKHPKVAADFFGLLRSWHERGKNELIWKKLRLVIVHSKEVYIPLNINQSPFNVGLPIELPELNQSQVQDLIIRHGLNWNSLHIDKLIHFLGGHPYLIQVALYEIARGRINLDSFIQISSTEEGVYSDHLRRHLLNLQQDNDLLWAFKKVISADVCVDVGTNSAFKLRSMGLVKFQGNAVIPFCDLYRHYFSNRLEIN